MSYSNLHNDFDSHQSDSGTSGSPFDAPMEMVRKELSWLLTEPKYQALEAILLEGLEDVEDLRAAILVNTNKFTSQAMNHILNEIDRIVDEYRRSVALL